jgi:hypothetical protein
MRRRRITLVSLGVLAGSAIVASAALVAGGSHAHPPSRAVAAAHASPAASGWHQAQPVPGLAALNRGGDAALSALSCFSPGNCSGGGSYDSHGYTQAFVVSQKGGTWGQAQPVPGLAALNQGGQYAGGASLTSISCPQPGDCTAVGGYQDSRRYGRVFVVTQSKGVWGQAVEVPGTKELGLGGAYNGISAVSCSSPGNCAAGGTYEHGFGQLTSTYQAFVVTERRGVWGQATEVPGIAALNQGGGNGTGALVTSVSCPAAGDCVAGGSYQSKTLHSEAFLAVEQGGVWGQARPVPGLAVLNTGHRAGGARVDSVSCWAPGNCGAAGTYEDRTGGSELFVVSETGKGSWQSAEPLPGLAGLNSGGLATLTQLSCRSLGNCSAGGSYTAGQGRTQAFVASETSGVWGQAREVAGPLNAGGRAEVESLACFTGGDCSAGGYYTSATGTGGPRREQAFVVNETDGVWGAAAEVPGTGALNRGGDAAILSVSCPALGQCSAAGGYQSGRGVQAFVVSRT